MFVEEPVPQENVDALKLVSDHVPFPIATGERLLSRWEFRTIFEKQACAYIQPDGAHAGGISELKRIANMAEVYYIHTMPHCAIGAVALAACLHVDAAVPNFLIQEMIGPEQMNGPVRLDWTLADGHMELSTAPGLGVDRGRAGDRGNVRPHRGIGRRVVLRVGQQRRRLVGVCNQREQRHSARQ